MTKPENQNPEWEVRWGAAKIKVTSDMVISALDKAISTVLKELENNRTIRGSEKLYYDWEISHLILSLLRSKFEFAVEMEAKGRVHLRIPGRTK
jgi:hypothetical protein